MVTFQPEQELAITAIALANFPESKFTSYELDGKSYLLRKTSEGYSFYEESEDAPNGLQLMGTIEQKEDGAVYSSIDGMEYIAGFNDSGDFIIESEGSVIRYTVQN